MVEIREYQKRIIESAKNNNTLVVLPTGLGKTLIAFELAKFYLSKNKKIIFLAPTRPLVLQHQKSAESHLGQYETTLFTGQIKAEKRAELFLQNQIIFSTPQGFENDLLTKKIDLKSVGLVVFDEAHKATGSYAYTFIANEFHKQNELGRILALTASPGSDMESILGVCDNLFINNLEYRSINDFDVKPYIQKSVLRELVVEFPDELKGTQKLLNDCMIKKLDEIRSLGYLLIDKNNLSRTKLLFLQSSLSKKMLQGDKNFELLKSISLCAQVLKVAHAVELLETQSLESLIDYFNQIFEQSKKTKVKATLNLVKDPLFLQAFQTVNALNKQNFVHPKLNKLHELLTIKFEKSSQGGSNYKCIIFNQFRDSAISVFNSIQKLNGVKPVLFFGQSKKKGQGHSQKEQKQIIDDFRNGDYNVLIATSVAEEGLDIPSVDSVIFFEPVPSAIRSIQRRGRTGRQDSGEIYVLINKGTRDEAYKWSSYHKEKKMYRNLEELKKTFGGNSKLNSISVADSKPHSKVIKKTSYFDSSNSANDIKSSNAVDSELLESFDLVNSLVDHSDPLLEDYKQTQQFENKSPVQKKIIHTTKQSISSDLQTNLFSFSNSSKYFLYVDHREKGAHIVKELFSKGVDIKLKQLSVADYVVSEKIAIEYKLEHDFVSSIMDGRLFSQAKDLSSLYLNSIIIVESEAGIFNSGTLSSQAIYGAINSLMFDFNIQVIFTRNKVESADLIYSIIKREQSNGSKFFSPHASNKPKDEIYQIEYIVSSFPGVGYSLAKSLLSHFGSVKNIANASLDQLMKVEKIGESKAKQIHNAFNKKYS